MKAKLATAHFDGTSPSDGFLTPAASNEALKLAVTLFKRLTKDSTLCDTVRDVRTTGFAVYTPNTLPKTTTTPEEEKEIKVGREYVYNDEDRKHFQYTINGKDVTDAKQEVDYGKLRR